MDVQVPCIQCKGYGKVPVVISRSPLKFGAPETCPGCEGKGYHVQDEPPEDVNKVTTKKEV